MFAYIRENLIKGIGGCPRTEEGTLNILISDEIAENIEQYIYDGSDIILDPEYEEKQAQKERIELDMLSLTKREVFLALYKAKGVTPEMVRSQITDPEALIEFDFASEYYRGNPLINAIGQSLGFTVSELDYLFKYKSLPDYAPDNLEETEGL